MPENVKRSYTVMTQPDPTRLDLKEVIGQYAQPDLLTLLDINSWLTSVFLCTSTSDSSMGPVVDFK